MLNTLRLRQNGLHFADGILQCIVYNEKIRGFIKMSVKSVPMGLVNKNPALVEIMAWTGDTI